ncbi:MAG TPA: ThuA domain-containing protein [Candidatus Hydrogenedentes bacterium]|mgnify:CR=1 FL=1|nr:ThuA domain-containing protein [Candidatus Hydrogenedentota bacterium]
MKPNAAFLYCVFTSLLFILFSLPLGAQNTITSAIAPDDPVIPNGYRIAAYLDCGAQMQSPGEAGPYVKMITGETFAFPGISGPIGDCAWDEKQVEAELTGLDPKKEYVLGVTWWDADKTGRCQSVKFGIGEPIVWTPVLPATQACAFNAGESTWARLQLPLTGGYAGKKQLRVAFVHETGPNAVVNELWLLEKTESVERKRVLIVTGDDYPGHVWRETCPPLAGILREDARLEIAITESPAILGSPLLTHYDAVVLHFKNYAERLPLSKEILSGLEQYVNSGHGMAMVHFGCGAFQELPDFVKIAGRIWNPSKRGHDPYGAFDVRITEPNHPITKDMKPFTTQDELYTCLDGATPIRVLCEATSKVDQQSYPMAFVVDNPRGRIFHCLLGHDVKAFSAPGVHELYRRAAAWAAGLK